MKFFRSATHQNNPKQVSCWDEPVKQITMNPTAPSLPLQLVGVTVVLTSVLAISVCLGVVITGITIVTTNGTTTLETSLKSTSTTTSTTSSTSFTSSTTSTTSTTSKTTTTTTSNPYACSTMTFYNQTDFPGNDIISVSSMNFTSCCTLCLNTAGCLVFSLVLSGNVCYTKTSIGSGPISAVQILSARF